MLANAPVSTATRNSPEWWLDRLSRRLDYRLGRVAINGVRATSIDRWAAYYAGRLNLALQSDKWRAEFAARFPAYSANFMELVVDKHRERLSVQGIRFGSEPGSDDALWEWWQRNHMDAESLKLHRETLVNGQAYALVWPGDDGEIEISIESAREVVVETASGKSWKRLAALKRYLGDDLHLHAELYTPTAVYRYRSTQKDSEFSLFEWSTAAKWEREQRTGEDWPIPNPINVVPMVPYVHKPNLLNEGSSKIEPVASCQDAINKYRVDAFVASEFASFRQRWAIGVDIPVDPITGQPVEDFKAAVDRLWNVPPPNPDEGTWDAGTRPQFGEFDVTPLAPFYTSITGETQIMGAISRTPYHHLLPQSGQPPSGDSLRAAEAGLTAEVVDSQLNLGDSHEELFHVKLLWDEDPRADQVGAEIIWRDPETQTEGEHVDALMKMKALGVPEEALWERMHGVTQQTIKRWKRLLQQEELMAALRPQPAFTVVPPTATTQPEVTSGGPPAG